MSEETKDCVCHRQNMSIHTRKITDACRDKDCIEDLRVYLTRGSQQILDSSANVRVRSAELLTAYIDVEPVAFDRNHYFVDVTFYYKILADATAGGCRPTTLCGLASFSKRAVLCGEDSQARIFRSDTRIGEPDGCTQQSANRPIAVVEVLEPMVLSSRVREEHDCCCENTTQFPENIRTLYDEELACTGGKRRLYVTLGQFSILRLERDAQIVVPMVEYSMPHKECCENPGCCNEDPCEAFSRIPFPTTRFSSKGCDDGHCSCKEER